MDKLRFVDACTEEHFKAMSLIHALGWRDMAPPPNPTGGPQGYK